MDLYNYLRTRKIALAGFRVDRFSKQYSMENVIHSGYDLDENGFVLYVELGEIDRNYDTYTLPECLDIIFELSHRIHNND